MMQKQRLVKVFNELEKTDCQDIEWLPWVGSAKKQLTKGLSLSQRTMLFQRSRVTTELLHTTGATICCK